jgi:PAS domain S-box-containing protein
MPYVAMLASFLVLVYLETNAPANPANSMTIVIFVLTLLVMLRQGVLSRDDALLRERRAVGLVEARYASLIKNASDVIMIVDVDGRLRFGSPAAERTFGIPPDDLVGRNLLDLWSESNRERLTAFLAELDATRGRTVGPFEVVVDTSRDAARSSAWAAICSMTRPLRGSRSISATSANARPSRNSCASSRSTIR